MDKKFRKFNIVIISAFVYSLSVHLTLHQEETSRILLYRLINTVFLILIIAINYKFIVDYSSSLLKIFLIKLKNFFGYSENVKKEDKVRTFIEYFF